MKDSTIQLSRTTLLATVAAAALLLQAVAACGDTEQSSSSTNWLPCRSDEDCERFPGAHCGGDRVCADESGEPIPATAEPATGGRSSTGGRAATGGRPATGGAMSSGGTAQPSRGGSSGDDGGTAGAAEAGSGGAEPEGGSGGAPPTTGGSSTGGSSTGGASCDGWPTPMLDKSCQADDDCFVAGYMFNCCGSVRMTSFNVTEQTALEEHRKSCDRVPVCDCLSENELDDGTPVPFDATLVAECVETRCETRCADSGC